MKIYDISVTIDEGMVVWPGSEPVKLTFLGHVDRGDQNTSTQMSMNAHTGTHVDAPLHFVKGGVGVDLLDLNVLVGPARVVDAGNADALTRDVFEGLNIPPGAERLLVHTRNSGWWAHGETAFHDDYVAVTKDGAEWLVEHGVKLIGVDYLSVAWKKDTASPHHVLLGAEVIPLEGLNLTGIEPGMYQLVALPMKLAGRDGAPTRAILIQE